MDSTKQNLKLALICLSCGLFYFFQNTQATMFNSLNVPLMQEFSLSAKQVTVLSTAYFYSNILFLFAAGVMIDYLSQKKLILLACGINILSVLGFSIAKVPLQIFICHFISGLAGTFSLLAPIRLLSNWLPEKKLATFTGFIVMIGALGGVASQTPFLILIAHLGWRTTLQISTTVGILAFITILLFVQDYPSNAPKIELEKFNYAILKKNLQAVLKKRTNWLLGVCCAFMNMPAFILAALWGNLFLTQTYSQSRTTAGTICSMIAIGGMSGSFLLAALSDYLNRRKVVVISANIMAFILVSVIFFVNLPHPILITAGTLFFILGLTSGIQPVLYTLTAELNDKKLISSAQGLAMTIMMSGGLLQNVFSWALELNWNHMLENGVPIFSQNDYRNGGIILLIGYAIAFILILLIKESKQKIDKT